MIYWLRFLGFIWYLHKQPSFSKEITQSAASCSSHWRMRTWGWYRGSTETVGKLTGGRGVHKKKLIQPPSFQIWWAWVLQIPHHLSMSHAPDSRSRFNSYITILQARSRNAAFFALRNLTLVVREPRGDTLFTPNVRIICNVVYLFWDTLTHSSATCRGFICPLSSYSKRTTRIYIQTSDPSALI